MAIATAAARMGKRLATNAAGFSMIEVLVTLVIIMLGLMGLLAMQLRSHQAELESYQRSQSRSLLSDFVVRVNAIRKAARCNELHDAPAGSPYLGYGSKLAPSCTSWGTAELQAQEVADHTEWDDLLKGEAETLDGSSV